MLDLDFEPESSSAARDVEPIVVQEERKAGDVVPAGEALKPGYVPTRKSSLPVIELLVAALLIVGAVAAIWILRSTLPNKARTQSHRIAVTIEPASVTVRAGKEVDFAAAVSGDANNEVDWSTARGRGSRASEHQRSQSRSGQSVVARDLHRAQKAWNLSSAGNQ